ncbi:MAG: hypothetical protein Q4C37_10155 [Bacteroidales bacterium]|nr:hypothetical protein [Bacteroidales bacterium]
MKQVLIANFQFDMVFANRMRFAFGNSEPWVYLQFAFLIWGIVLRCKLQMQPILIPCLLMILKFAKGTPLPYCIRFDALTMAEKVTNVYSSTLSYIG